MYDATALAELADDGSIEVPPGASSLAFLQAVYRSPDQPLHTRMRAAIAALPYEHPKLAVTVQVDGAEGWAAQLQRCIARSSKVLDLYAAEPPTANGARLAPTAQEVSAAAQRRPMVVIRRR
jgi:hypothetical protein